MMIIQNKMENTVLTLTKSRAFFRWKILLVLILTIASVACKKPKTEIPKDVIVPDSMVMVLADVHLAEAAMLQLTITTDSGNYYAPSYYKYIFQKHNITAQDYNRSLKFYAAHPDIYSKIYEKVITELSAEQAKATK